MAQTVLVGSTGFVGGNLMAAHTFDAAYHSTDVAEGFGCRNELVVYAGVPAAMFLANRDPAADLHTLTPALLKPEKYAELAARSALVAAGYEDGRNGFYRLSGRVDAAELRAFFAANGWNALAFTDSRSKYQFYPLARLWRDIETALAAGLTVLNLTPPPVSAAEVYAHLTGSVWQNHLAAAPFDYDLRSRHAALLGGQGGYLCTKEEELAEIAAFMKGWT